MKIYALLITNDYKTKIANTNWQVEILKYFEELEYS